METKKMTHLAALGLSKPEQEEMQAMVERMLGVHGIAPDHPRVLREKLEAKLAGISVSQMIIEDR